MDVCKSAFWYLILLFAIKRHALGEFVSEHYEKQDIPGSVLQLSGYLKTQHVTSLLQCAHQCSDDDACSDIFYNSDEESCLLHDATAQYGNVYSVPASNAVHYKHDNVLQQMTIGVAVLQQTTIGVAVTQQTTSSVVPTTDVTTVPQAGVFLECPVNGGGWAAARLTNGSSYKFKLFRSVIIPQADAMASCTSEGGNLLKILTKEKLNFVQNNLTQCADVSGYNYWVDGSNAGAANPKAVDAYKTVDNETIPMGSDFWLPTLPDRPEDSPCIWIYDVFGYTFDDIPCSHTSATGPYYICEKSL